MTESQSSRNVTALVACFAAVYLVWGSTYLAIRIAIDTLPPLLMAGSRFMIAGAVLWLIMRMRGEVRPTWTQARQAGIIGLFLLVGGNGLVCLAEQAVPSGIAALLVGALPLWMVLLDWLALGAARPTRRVAAGLMLGFVGVAMLVYTTQGAAEPHREIDQAAVRWGSLALLLASVSWAIGSLRARRVDQGPSRFVASAVQMMVGGAVMFGIGTLRGEWSGVQFSEITVNSLLALAYLIVFGSLIGYSAYGWLLHNVSPAAVSTYAYVNPVVAVLLGWGLGGENVTAGTLLSGAMVIGAVALMMIPARKPALMKTQHTPPVPVSPAK